MQKGFLVRHSAFGVGRVLELDGNRITVGFFFPKKERHAFVSPTKALKRALLALGTPCKTRKGESVKVTKFISAEDSKQPSQYQIKGANGLEAQVSECDIVPVEAPRAAGPLEALAELDVNGYEAFQKRFAFLDAWWTNVRGAMGLTALLSSRIDLRPHQAFVAGTVLLDRIPRYILADEVGLGKTIEAGIIIHDILQQNSSARILVICPDTLTRQWLCELYSKFSGKVFSLLELQDGVNEEGTLATKTIASFSSACNCSQRLLNEKWDLIVIDEVHNLLAAKSLYELAQKLSGRTSGCLLLSALPAQHREEEYLRLLALLEPDRYDPDSPAEKKRFRELYSRQIELGRKLSYLTRHLGKYDAGNRDPISLVKKFNELRELPVLAQDSSLAQAVGALDHTSTHFVATARAILYQVGDRYRISRRILRNRRSHLHEAEPNLRIARRLNRVSYASKQLEIDVANAVRQLLKRLHEMDVADSVLIPLARNLFQASCDPDCLISFLKSARSETGILTSITAFDGHVGYESWVEYESELWGRIAVELPKEELQELLRAATLWQNGAKLPGRLVALLNFLKLTHKQNPSKKLIIFAGFFGLVPRVVNALRSEFGEAAAARFSWDLKNSEKEKQVNRFARDNQCWLLVSDETGGEGRNFQFVDELIHYDLPWHISRIEQRIGRLDRLGRSIPEVCSNVLYAEGGEDDGLLSCLENGFQIFSRSISGLEFALSGIEKNLIACAISDGCEGLRPFAVNILQEAEKERAEDDVQAVFEAASLERTSADAYRRVQSTPERDEALERAFSDYFQFMGGRDSMRVNPRGYPEGTFEFRPNELREVTIQLPVEGNGAVSDRIGTFRRSLAQGDPNLEYFSVGNDLFDAVCATLHKSVTGRVYAVECDWPANEWRGFEFAYRPTGGRDLLGPYPGLLKHLDRIFAVRLGHCFVTETLQPDPDQATLLQSIRQGLKREDKDTKWRNFTLKNGRVQLLMERYPDWSNLVAQAETVARSAARDHFTLALASAIDVESKRIEEQIRQARLSKSDQWEDEVAGLNALREAINRWDLELDFAGFLSVNGSLIP